MFIAKEGKYRYPVSITALDCAQERAALEATNLHGIIRVSMAEFTTANAIFKSTTPSVLLVWSRGRISTTSWGNWRGRLPRVPRRADRAARDPLPRVLVLLRDRAAHMVPFTSWDAYAAFLMLTTASSTSTKIALTEPLPLTPFPRAFPVPTYATFFFQLRARNQFP